ncbi:hypothetical protein PI124_g13886 [Phytophthora idaei]|uniref:RxLR effector protein n=1 Tax=Phytophthora aleatoria TaxID=2496075 RepID=A0A8J5M6H7_9STRA|nr:hypothetical protein PI125_g13504 [Phytophthora idaei]KAG3148371.1 hypothetical protein PI126_g12465 [Phytophthora idaei]KAG3241239.1 hypothetical protein PI124_g13886 [Phytophthora idaei]KAG6960275.1 hypothetical protein JG688_00009675 [Phytophthora aleatoria]
MHRCCFLFVVVFALATCCYSLADAEGIITIKDSALDSTRVIANSGNVRRYLKGSKTTTDEERAFPGITSLKTLMQKTPHVDKLKSMVKENPALAQANVFVSKRPRLKAALLIVKGQLKPLAIIGALALTGGYIMYLVKK